jgi:hypothetical protein
MHADSLVLELGGHVRFIGVSLLTDTTVFDRTWWLLPIPQKPTPDVAF